jgi:hypothetical protein
LTLHSATFDAEFAASNADAKSIAFSSVSGATANKLLGDLYLTEIDGFAEAPFETPAGQRPYSEEKGTQTLLATTFALYAIEHCL